MWFSAGRVKGVWAPVYSVGNGFKSSSKSGLSKNMLKTADPKRSHHKKNIFVLHVVVVH